MSENQATLFAKIAAITGELGAIGKDNKHYHGYNYVSADNLRGVMRLKFAEHNITIIPGVLETTVQDNWDITTYQFILCCGDTGATFAATFPMKTPMLDAKGKTDDKVSGKAMTYAMKYWMMALFQVSDQNADDLDKDYQDKAPPPRTNNNRQQPNNVTDLPQLEDGQEGYAQATTQVQVLSTKGDSFRYVIGGAAMFTPSPLEELFSDHPNIAGKLSVIGDVTLPDDVSVVYVQSGKWQNIARIRRNSTGEVYDLSKKSITNKAS